MKEVEIGDFVNTIHGVQGILTRVASGNDGLVAFLATANMRTYYCPAIDLRLDGEQVTIKI